MGRHCQKCGRSFEIGANYYKECKECRKKTVIYVTTKGNIIPSNPPPIKKV